MLTVYDISNRFPFPQNDINELKLFRMALKRIFLIIMSQKIKIKNEVQYNFKYIQNISLKIVRYISSVIHF